MCDAAVWAQSAADSGLRGRVLVGYQGWFRCPGDGSPGNRWNQWSKGSLGPETISVDLYPDTSELSLSAVCPINTESDAGRPANLFSSFSKETVLFPN